MFVHCRFASAFYLLLPADVIPGSTESTFADTPGEALVTVFIMMLGAFELDDLKASAFPHLTLVTFVLFMLIVAVVMFNAVIAIMVS